MGFKKIRNFKLISIMFVSVQKLEPKNSIFWEVPTKSSFLVQLSNGARYKDKKSPF
jgi:hypothetical protein